MIDTVVIATDGSASVRRAVETALDLADRFDAAVHALYVVDSGHVDALPERLHGEVADALSAQGEDAIEIVRARARSVEPAAGDTDVTAAGDTDVTTAGDTDPPGDREVATAIREGRPVREICDYARDVDADVVAVGTRGRHGEHSFLLGSVAENLVRGCPVPVLTVRQLDPDGRAGARPASAREGA